MRLLLAFTVVSTLGAGLALGASTTPTLIDSRDDWLRLGIPGNGTIEDPFVLEGLRFEMSRDAKVPALTIRDVPDHAIVRHVLVIGGQTGVFVKDAPNVFMQNITVRRATVGVHAINATVDHLSVLESPLGMRASRVVVNNSIFVDNEVAIQGDFVSANNSRFTNNANGIVVEEQGSLAIGEPTPIIRRSLFEDSIGRAIQYTGDVDILNSTFERNGVGIRYAGAWNNATIRGSNFGNHTKAAVQAVPTGGGWSLDLSNNWWGFDSDGQPTAPSPFGYGPPVQGSDPSLAAEDIPIEFDPIADAPFDALPEGQPGAVFPNASGPEFVELTFSFTPTGEDTQRVVLTGFASDPDGVASWSITGAGVTRKGSVERETKAEIAFTGEIPGSAEQVEFVLTATDLYGMTSRTNLTARPTVPEEPANETPPAPVENESGWTQWVGAIAMLVVAAQARRISSR